jgi:hypothetical protein
MPRARWDPARPAETGWPFLIAAGRRRGYSVLVAPDFLVSESEYGVLLQAVTPISESVSARSVHAVTTRGRRLTITYTAHLLTADDLIGPGRVSHRPTGEPRDEHSRPLRLMFGFVSTGGSRPEPVTADLDHCSNVALDAYRRFLAHEDGFTVEPSHPFLLQSRVVAPQPAVTVPQPPVIALSPVGGSSSSAQDQHPRTSAPVPLTVFALGIALVVVVTLALLSFIPGRHDSPPPARTPSTSAPRATPGGDASGSDIVQDGV